MRKRSHSLDRDRRAPRLMRCRRIGCRRRGSDSQDFTQIEKGRYLADRRRLRRLPHACRTAASRSPAAAPIETPFGIITSPNITPDRETGIGAWTDEQFDDARAQGRAAGRQPALSGDAVTPSYTKMSRDDVLAIRAYLKTVEPVHHPVDANTLPFPFNIRTAMRVWDGLYFTRGRIQARSADNRADWNRGAYLVAGSRPLQRLPHAEDRSSAATRPATYLHGFNLQGWFAPDITNDNSQGLGRWSERRYRRLI